MHAMPQQVRTPLEPISATFVAVALLHLLGAIIAWRLLSTPVQSGPAAEDETLVWMAPVDFTQPASPQSPSSPPKPAPVPPSSKSTPSPLPAKPVSAPPSTKRVATPLPKLQPASTDKPKAVSNGAAPGEAPKPRPALPPSARPAGKEANKFITLSRLSVETDEPPAPPRPYKPVLSLLDIAAINDVGKNDGSAARRPPTDDLDDAVVDAFLKAWVAPPIEAVSSHQRRAGLRVSIARNGAVSAVHLALPSGSPVLDNSILEAAKQVTKVPVSLPSSFSKERYDLQINFQIE